jgi:hypothetical protein
MSKEMLVIAIGLLLVVQTQFGVPDSWHTALVVFSGIVCILLGFFLRTEALARGGKGSSRQTFVENTSHLTAEQHGNERKEGITSLN